MGDNNSRIESRPHAGPVVMGSMCAGSVRCYAAMVAAGEVIIDPLERHLPLRHSHHRYMIDGPNGKQTLTVHLDADTNAMPVTMADIRISEHGNWRHLHWGALMAAYGRSPYFDFVAPELQPIIMGDEVSLLEFNMRLHRLIVEFMDLPITTTVAASRQTISDAIANGACDLRGKIGTKKPDRLPINNVPYYQVWQQRHGFLPNLSILDLLCNQGREAIFTLQNMYGEFYPTKQ